MELTGNYFLKLKFGDDELLTTPDTLKDVTLIQYMDKFVPSLKLQLVDSQGLLQHLFPFDKYMSRIFLQFGLTYAGTEFNSFDYMVWRRYNETLFQESSVYDVGCLMDVKDLFYPTHIRSWDQSVRTTLTDIAINEMKVDEVDISPSLDYVKQIIQPSWSNLQLFSYLKKNLEGSDGEFGYKIYFKNVDGKTIFVCRTYEELINQSIKYKFMISDIPYKDFYPIYDFDIKDNYKIWGFQRRGYSYFDYDNSELVDVDVNVNEFPSLTFYHMMEKDDGTDSYGLSFDGRSNDFSSTFVGRAKSRFQEGLMNLVQMWTLTHGITNIAPGDLVEVIFAQSFPQADINRFQYSGYWLVKRVVHQFGDTHRMRLLLIRNGLNTDLKTTLVPASVRKV